MSQDPIRDLFEQVHTIAVVGCSRDPAKDAHRIPAFLQERGYRIVPVNPHAEQILGETCYPDLVTASAALEKPIEVVDVFRPPEDTPPVAEQAARVGARALWLQLGIRNEEAGRIARNAGMTFVQDRCMKPEFSRRFGNRRRSDLGSSSPS